MCIRDRAFRESGDTRRDGVDVERFADDARGCHHNVLRTDAELFCDELAHPCRNLLAVRVAGVGVSAVADDGLRLAVGQIALGDDERRTLHEIRRVHGRRAGGHFTENQRKITFFPVFPNSAMNAARRESFCGAHAASDQFHTFLSPGFPLNVLFKARDLPSRLRPAPDSCTGRRRPKRLFPDCRSAR